MFRRFFLMSPLPIVVPLALLAVPSALQAQINCIDCNFGQNSEPSSADLPPAPIERAQKKGGNGRGNNGNGNGNGNGGANNGGGGADDGDGGPAQAGCGNGVGGGNGNGTTGNGVGNACGDGSGGNNGGGNNGGGNGNGGSNGAPDLFIQNEINFGRLILLGNGDSSVLMDLESGQKITAGNLDDYGGLSMVGRATVTGRPNSEVQVTFPDRITMRDPRGGIAELREFTTSLPLVPRLDNTGTLEFSFTGKLTMTNTIGDGGDLRGRVPITVEYN